MDVLVLNKLASLRSEPLKGQSFIYSDANGVVHLLNDETPAQGQRDVCIADLARQYAVYSMSIATQGNTSTTASVIEISQKDLAGNLIGGDDDLLRVMVCNTDGTISTNATIAAANGSALVYDYGTRLGTTAAKDIVIRPSNQAYASLTTNLTGATNNDLVFTAVTPGRAGNAIKVAYVNPGTPSATESVAVSQAGGYNVVTFNLATDAGTAQVETAAVTSAAGPTEDDVLHIIVTSALFTEPRHVQCALLDADASASAVATKIRTALTADSVVSEHFTIGGSSANVLLTAKVAAANDSTLNVEWYGVSGVTDLEASSNTTAGVAPAITSTGDTLKATLLASAAASALVTATDKSGNDGSGLVAALSATALTGGGTGSNAKYYVALTDAQAESVVVKLGTPPIGSWRPGDFRATQTVTHAA